MADIISFHEAVRRLSRVVDRVNSSVVNAPAGPAQLLFFTGVRYERRDGEAVKKPRKRKAAVRGADAAVHS